MAATDQKNGPDPLTHRSVTVTDDPPRSPRRAATDPDETTPASAPLRLLYQNQKIGATNDRNNIIERQGPQATVP
jgi:hypothetical protein